MSKKIRKKSARKKTALAETPQMLTPEEVVAQLRGIISSIPDYVPVPKATARARRAASHVRPQFVDSAMSAIDASASVRDALGVTTEQMRADVDQASRWSAVADVLREMLGAIDAAVLTRKYRVGLTSLTTYSISRELVRHPDQAILLPHLDNMKRTNRYGRHRKQATPPTPAPQAPSQQ
jgi:hypothetical protein